MVIGQGGAFARIVHQGSISASPLLALHYLHHLPKNQRIQELLTRTALIYYLLPNLLLAAPIRKFALTSFRPFHFSLTFAFRVRLMQIGFFEAPQAGFKLYENAASACVSSLQLQAQDPTHGDQSAELGGPVLDDCCWVTRVNPSFFRVRTESHFPRFHPFLACSEANTRKGGAFQRF